MSPPCPHRALPECTPHVLCHGAAWGTGPPPRGSEGEVGHGSEQNETHTSARTHTRAHTLPRTGARGHRHTHTPALAVFKPGQHPSFWGQSFGDLGWGLWGSAPPLCVSFMSDLGQACHPGFHFSQELDQGVGPRNVPCPVSLTHWVLRWQLTWAFSIKAHG